MFSPLAILPPDWLFLIGIFGVVGILGWAAYLLCGSWGIMAMPLLLVTFSGRSMALHGHLSYAVLALCGVVFIKHHNDHPGRAGLAAGVAATLKLFPGLWIASLALTRHWPTFWAATGVFAGLNLAGLQLPGVQVGRVPQLFSITDATSRLEINGSLLGLGWPIWAVVAAVVAFLLFWPRRSLIRASLPFSILASPVGWIAYLMLIFPTVNRRAMIAVLGTMLLVRITATTAFSFGLQVATFCLAALLIVLTTTESRSHEPTAHKPRTAGKAASALAPNR